MPATDDVQGYMMLRRPRKAYWVSQKELDYENSDANVQKKEDMLDNFFDVGIDGGRRGTSSSIP